MPVKMYFLWTVHQPTCRVTLEYYLIIWIDFLSFSLATEVRSDLWCVSCVISAGTDCIAQLVLWRCQYYEALSSDLMGSMSVDKLRPMPALHPNTHTHTLSIPGYCSNKMIYPYTICLALCLGLDYVFSRHESMADLTSLALFDRFHTSFSDSALILSAQTLPVSPLPIFRTTCHAVSRLQKKTNSNQLD